MIYSLTPFFNELDVLEIRLATLDPVVDVHVICEASVTHSGSSKPFFFDENRERYRKWWDKIEYVQADLTGCTDAPSREAEQRRQCARGLPARLDPWDYILLSDADEIPNPDILLTPALATDGSLAFHIVFPMYLYHLNWRWEEIESVFTICRMFPALWVKNNDLETIRWMGLPQIIGSDVGWHMAYMGGPETIEYKLRSFLHYDHPEFTPHMGMESIEETLATGVDLFRRSTRIVREAPLNELPPYIGENYERFVHLLWQA